MSERIHPNAVAYLEAIEAFNRGDLDAVRERVSGDVVYRIPGSSPIAGEYDGIEGFAHRFVEGQLAEAQVFVSDPAHVDAFWS